MSKWCVGVFKLLLRCMFDWRGLRSFVMADVLMSIRLEQRGLHVCP